MTLPDFSQHLPALEDGVRLIKAGIYINLAKKFMSVRPEEDAAKLAFCVTASLFLMPLEQEKYSTFADAHSDLVETSLPESLFLRHKRGGPPVLPPWQLILKAGCGARRLRFSNDSLRPRVDIERLTRIEAAR